MKQMIFIFKWWVLYDYTAVMNFRSKKSDFAGSPLLGTMFSKGHPP